MSGDEHSSSEFNSEKCQKFESKEPVPPLALSSEWPVCDVSFPFTERLI